MLLTVLKFRKALCGQQKLINIARSVNKNGAQVLFVNWMSRDQRLRKWRLMKIFNMGSKTFLSPFFDGVASLK